MFVVARALVRFWVGVLLLRADIVVRAAALRADVAERAVVFVRVFAVLRKFCVMVRGVVARAFVAERVTVVNCDAGREIEFALRSAALALPTPAINAIIKNIILSITYGYYIIKILGVKQIKKPHIVRFFNLHFRRLDDCVQQM